MKLAVALFLALVAPSAAFVPSTSCRGGVTASRTRSINAWRAKEDNLTDASNTADTQDKKEKHEDEDGSVPRKAFSAAPTFEEFLKFKQAERGETELKIP